MEFINSILKLFEAFLGGPAILGLVLFGAVLAAAYGIRTSMGPDAALAQTIRRTLDSIYLASGVLAALCLIAILSLIVIQMLARWTGEVFPGAPAYVAYAMAAASFLAFANALNRGAHIRVSILVNAVGPRAKWVLETWCFDVGTAVAWYVVFYACRFVYWSWKFKDISQEQDKTLLWIPQSVMLTGAIILAIALTDHLISLLLTGKHRIVRDTVDSHAE